MLAQSDLTTNCQQFNCFQEGLLLNMNSTCRWQLANFFPWVYRGSWWIIHVDGSCFNFFFSLPPGAQWMLHRMNCLQYFVPNLCNPWCLHSWIVLPNEMLSDDMPLVAGGRKLLDQNCLCWTMGVMVCHQVSVCAFPKWLDTGVH